MLKYFTTPAENVLEITKNRFEISSSNNYKPTSTCVVSSKSYFYNVYCFNDKGELNVSRDGINFSNTVVIIGNKLITTDTEGKRSTYKTCIYPTSLSVVLSTLIFGSIIYLQRK